jgi:hypothetical protein
MPEGLFSYGGPDELRQLVGFLATRGATVRDDEIDRLDISAFVPARPSDPRLDFHQVKLGESIFRGKGQCISCHPLAPGPALSLRAPSLLSVGSLDAGELRQAIEEPSRRVLEAYQHASLHRKDGRIVQGRLIEKTALGIHVLKTDEGGDLDTEFVPFEEMECSGGEDSPMYRVSKSSIMPDVKGALTRDEITALVAFLKNRHGNR